MIKKKADGHVVIRVVVRFLIPFIFMYGLYIQWHGEHSAGGGFQAGVICAAAFIVYGLLYGLEELEVILPLWVLKLLSSVGISIYTGVGVAALMLGGQFLDYSVFSKSAVSGQMLGIMLIEIGVGVTVFSVMLTIYYTFSERLLNR